MKRLVLDYLEETSKLFSEKTAFADVEDSISFSELVFKAKRIASSLIPLTQEESVIPFYLEKSVTAVTGFFGAIYAGCAYSQLNPRFPSARINMILEQIQPSVIVTDRLHRKSLAEITQFPIVVLEDLLVAPLSEELLMSRRAKMTDHFPLYVNFTSGSTGAPKGVVVSHLNVVDFISDFVQRFSITDHDVLGNQAPFDFDVSVKDIYSGIFTGALVVIIPTEYFSNPVKLGDLLYDRQITVLIWAVSALCFLTSMGILDYKTPTSVRAVMFSGEVMPIKHLKKLQRALPNAMYVNLYGPTEITCNCTYYILDRPFEIGDVIPIGVPFSNRKVFLLDENDQEVREPGGVGELCVAGSSVALGYLCNSEKTRECFCQNPLNHDWDERIYRTGDLIRITETGEMVYCSRKDFQIKHMGHRIELTEIDAVIQGVAGVDRACCQYRNGKIVAFVSGMTDTSTLSAELRTVLPEYMIPNVFVPVDQMPLNKNGKIDRKLLIEEYEKQ